MECTKALNWYDDTPLSFNSFVYIVIPYDFDLNFKVIDTGCNALSSGLG